MTEPRVAPLAPAELDERQRTFLRPFTDAKGRYPNIFGVLCRNMPLMEAWRPFGLYTMNGSALDGVLREVLVLRAAHNTGSDYEQHHHRRIALQLGMADAQVNQIGSAAATGEPDADLMIRIADELARDTRLSAATWEAAVDRLGLEATLDAIFTVGAYTALAMGLNSCEVQIEGRAPAA